VKSSLRFRVGILTCSTLGARGLRRDESGLLLAALCKKWFGAAVTAYRVVPDDGARIAAVLREWCRRGLDVILTTGGTGLSPTDVTPEATRRVLHREAPGLGEAMRQAGAQRTPMAWLSRGTAGLRGRTLIINLPGSPRGARESLSALRRLLPHALEISSGRHGGHARAGKR
jgi:molybdopterin adenylyltransferase